MPRIACAVVCALALLSGSPAHATDRYEAGSRFFASLSPVRSAAQGEGAAGALAGQVDLDLRLRTAGVDQPRWLGARTDEVSSSLRLFTPARRGVGASADATDSRRVSSSLRVRENSFPNRKVALQGAVNDGFFLKVSLGVDHELERGGIGRPTPSVGLLFEQTFR